MNIQVCKRDDHDHIYGQADSMSKKLHNTAGDFLSQVIIVILIMLNRGLWCNNDGSIMQHWCNNHITLFSESEIYWFRTIDIVDNDHCIWAKVDDDDEKDDYDDDDDDKTTKTMMRMMRTIKMMIVMMVTTMKMR